MNTPNIHIRRTKLLYHFTAARFVPSIQAQGLTRGSLPWHRCRKTGEPLVIRNWAERTMTARQIEGMRSAENTMRALAERGNPMAMANLVRLFPGFQWLTSNPSWSQPFALLGDLPFAKNSNRITVLVPETSVTSWRELCERHKPPAAEELNTPAVDWENWFLHPGPIPPGMFLEVARNPGEATAAAFVEGNG